jgi:hypothetical protein
LHRMIKLTAIIVKERDRTLIAQYPESCFLKDQDGVIQYEAYLKQKWSSVFGKDISVLLTYRERASKTIRPKQIFLETAKQMKLPQDMIFKSTKQGDITRARKFAYLICLDLDYSHSEIEHGTSLKNRVGYFYVAQLHKEFARDESLRLEYEDIKDRVVRKLYQT